VKFALSPIPKPDKAAELVPDLIREQKASRQNLGYVCQNLCQKPKWQRYVGSVTVLSKPFLARETALVKVLDVLAVLVLAIVAKMHFRSACLTCFRA
jgi:hypothetical protein